MLTQTYGFLIKCNCLERRVGGGDTFPILFKRFFFFSANNVLKNFDLLIVIKLNVNFHFSNSLILYLKKYI